MIPAIEVILTKLRNIIADVYEIAADEVDPGATFLEMGLDSISIIQVRQLVKNAYGLEISVDRLFGDTDNLTRLAEYIRVSLPAEDAGVVVEAAREREIAGPLPREVSGAREKELNMRGGSIPDAGNQFVDIRNIINDQLQVMFRQMEILSKMGN
jgi:acyl carrier protein